MPIELIPRKPVARPPWQTILFYVSLVFLGLSLISFFVITYFSSRAAAQSQLLAEELAKGKTPAEQALEKDILKRQRQILVLGSLLGQQKSLSSVLSFLERTVHPQVFFSKANLIAEENKISLSGRADNFRVLGEQMLFLRQEPLAGEINLLDVSISKAGGGDFTLEIVFDPLIFQTNQ